MKDDMEFSSRGRSALDVGVLFVLTSHRLPRVVIWITIDYLSACTSLVILLWFLSSTSCLTGRTAAYCIVFHTILCKTLQTVCEKSQKVFSFHNAQIDTSGAVPQSIAEIKIFPVLVVDGNINLISSPVSAKFNIRWTDYCIKGQLNSHS